MGLDDSSRYLEFTEIASLSEMAQEFLNETQLESLISRCVHFLCNRLVFESAAISLVDQGRIVLRASGTRDGGVVVDQQPHSLQSQSQMCIPIKLHDDVLGFIHVKSESSMAFEEGDIDLLRIFSKIVAPCIFAAKTLELCDSRTNESDLIRELYRASVTALEPSSQASAVCQAIVNQPNVYFASVIVIDPVTREIVCRGDAAAERASHFSEQTTQTWTDRLHQKLLDGPSDNSFDAVSSAANEAPAISIEHHGDRSLFFFRIADGLRGGLLLCRSERELTSADESLWNDLASCLAASFDNACLFERQRKRWQQLLVINEIARSATQETDPKRIVDTVAQQVHDRFRFYATGVWLIEESYVTLRVLIGAPPPPEDLETSHELAGSVFDQIFRNRCSIRIGGANSGLPWPALSKHSVQRLYVPLLGITRPLGVLQFESDESRRFNQDDSLVLETLAKSIGAAVENAHSAKQTEKLRQDLNDMIVHDLRNPVQALQLTLQEVLSHVQINPVVDQAVRDGIRSTDEILEMVGSLLDVARFEAGQVRIQPVPSVLNDHLRAAVRRLGPVARAKNVTVDLRLSDDIPVVYVDHDLIMRTFTNLLGNALKYAPSGALVTVCSDYIDCLEQIGQAFRQPHILVSIKDTGKGIPPDFHDKIFEKFGQVETRKAGLNISTGLGLTLCRYVVDAHGGRIWVESSVGHGATFFVALPTVANQPRSG